MNWIESEMDSWISNLESIDGFVESVGIEIDDCSGIEQSFMQYISMNENGGFL